MNRLEFWCSFTILALFALNVVFCGKSTLLTLDEADRHPKKDTFADHDNDFLLDTGKILKRNKRYLLFTNGGISKIVLGFLAPVETRDRVNWRTLNLAYNYQAQYIPIPNTTFLWTRFARDLRSQRKLYDQNGIYAKDLTRELVYGAMELFMEVKGKPGRECLLKSICDAAEHPIVHGSVFDEIVHLILSPNTDEAINDDYKNARYAGEHGADCGKLYHRCKYGDGILDKFSFLT